MERNRKLKPFAFVAPIAEQILNTLKNLDHVKNAAITGSIRRKKEMVQNINILVESYDIKNIADILDNMPGIEKVDVKENKLVLSLLIGIKVYVYFVTDDFYTGLQYFTGSKQHNKKLKKIAEEKGFILDKDGLFKEKEKIQITKERKIYQHLGMDFIPPELRECRGEFEKALEGNLPDLIKINDIKGDLHIHTLWSDGVDEIEDIAEFAQKIGYEYIAITDHSKSLKIANGLSREKLLKQNSYIKNLNKKYKIKILSGIEVDIKKDGSLDYSDDVLEKMDIVIASIHSGFNQDRHTITKRIVNAIENRYVNIIAHPTGRILGRRPPYAVDMEAVLQKAAENNKILELNSSPDRLDLNDKYCKKAKQMGVKIVINTDAHEKNSLYDIRYGINTARRGWLEKHDVLNTYSLHELSKRLKLDI